MLRLDLPTEPFWVDLPHDVRFRCKPLTTALNNAAGVRAGRRLTEQRGTGPAPDPDIERGALMQEAVVALAEVLVIEWEGVANAAGTEPAPLTPEGLRAVLSIPEMAGAFNTGVSAPLARMAAEGNA
jgi:hypothetical protein